MAQNKTLFLSIVSSEFRACRELLAQDLKRPNLHVAVQEDFGVLGRTTLEKLDTYIRHCDGVIHLIGKATGAVPEEVAVAALLTTYPDFAQRLPALADKLALPQPGFSYTQWEAYLAIYHRRPLFVYRPTDFELDALDVPRDAKFVFNADEVLAQKEHYQRIAALGHDRGQFFNEERLSSAVLRDLVEILPRLEVHIEVSPTRLRHTAERLIGRDEELTMLDKSWESDQTHVVVVRAFGGMGKTSLVATWMAELALKGWRGAQRVFDWSFYSQGTNEQSAASSDTFISAALTAFGDADPVRGSPWDRGARLARLVGEHRCLLVLDGLEPLQHAPGSMEGKLKDQAIEALLKGLCAHNAGLCVVTTREKVPDIQQHYSRTAIDKELIRLSDLAGAALLHHAGANRAGAVQIAPDDKELRAASREVHGHGLTLQLLGRYLHLVENGDILKRDTVRLADAEKEYQNDATRPYGHAFKAMEAYERWFQSEGAAGARPLAILRLLGLFDRPATKDCLHALCENPAIPGLTESLAGIADRDWRLAVTRLVDAGLLALQDDGSLDAHPLLREYFARQLREKHAEAWKAAHKRIYEHLCKHQEGDQPTLEDLQPLYQAVAHGCLAGLQQKACVEVYQARIKRLDESYSTKKLGAFGSDLGAVACFFEQPWSGVSTALTEVYQAWLLNEAAHRLRALGRLTEALEPMRAGLEMRIKQEIWKSAAAVTNNLSELELTLGEVNGAVRDAEQSVNYADRSRDVFFRMAFRTTHADALHQAGRWAEAETLFHEAEQMQNEGLPDYSPLSSVQGFQYCDVLLAEAERAAWWKVVTSFSSSWPGLAQNGTSDDTKRADWLKPQTLAAPRAVSERATQSLKIAERNNWLLDIALDHLTLGRAALYEVILSQSSSGIEPLMLNLSLPQGQDASKTLDKAVSGLRRAGTVYMLPLGILTRAWLRFLDSARTGLESAQADLDEAWDIAERGSMRLFMADIHLYRARLFGMALKAGQLGTYPWESPEKDLAEAERLINECGYHRRDEELADAKLALLGKG